MSITIIGIDHGNGNIKTKRCVYPCGFKKQDTRPSELFSADILEYRGSFYSLTPNRFPYELDKTRNGNCLVLTAFAIAKELKARAVEGKGEAGWKALGSLVSREVVLAVGLPPAHFEKQHLAFQNYFLGAARHGLEFTYNGKAFRLRVRDVLVFPQDYAASIIYKEELIKKYSTVYCIDIGDGTVDLLALKGGVPDKDLMLSRELGISRLREQVIDDIINDYHMTLDSAAIEDILSPGRESLAPKEVQERVRQETAEWAARIVDQLHTKVPDFRFAPTVFCGGGAGLLKPYLEQTGMFGMTDYIPDIHANAAGYEAIAGMVLGGQV